MWAAGSSGAIYQKSAREKQRKHVPALKLHPKQAQHKASLISTERNLSLSRCFHLIEPVKTQITF